MTPLKRFDGKLLYVLRIKSTKAVINPRAISNTLGDPVTDPSADLEYLPIMVQDRPDNDPTFTTVNTIEGPNESVPQWEIAYKVIDRPASEVKDIAANAKRMEADKQVPQPDFKETVILMLAAVLRDAKGLALTPDEQTAKDELMALAAVLKANKDNLADISAAIDSGSKPDLTAGWADAPR